MMAGSRCNLRHYMLRDTQDKRSALQTRSGLLVVNMEYGVVEYTDRRLLCGCCTD